MFDSGRVALVGSPAWSATKSSYEMGGLGGPGRYDLFRRDAEQEQIGVH